MGLGVTGRYGIVMGGGRATLRAIERGARLLAAGTCDGALVLAVEIFEECADLYTRHRRSYRWPLVETAACLWLGRGAGAISFESARARGRAAGAPGPGEPFAAGPPLRRPAGARRARGGPR